MDHKNVKAEGVEVDLERGMAVKEDDSKKVSPVKQGKAFFAKIYCGLVGKGEEKLSVYGNETNLNGVSMGMVKVTNDSLEGQDSINCADKTLVKEQRKKSSHKKAAKPPRPPRAPSLDSADLKLIREISELAMLKRARIERMKALKKMKATKSLSSSSSSGSNMLAMVFTVVFCIVILLQGMSSGKSSVASFQGSPVSTGGAEAALVAVQHQLNPPSSDPNAPGLESEDFVQQITSSDIPENLRRGAG